MPRQTVDGCGGNLMRLGIFAKTFETREALTTLRSVAQVGFSCTQFNMACVGLPSMPETIDDSVNSAIAAASSATGVAISAVSGTYNMIHPDPAVRETGMRRLEVLARACKNMGTDTVTLCTGTLDPDDQWRRHPDNGTSRAWRALVREMERAITVAERHDIWLGIEPELANVVSSAEKAVELIQQLRSNRLRIVLDPANLFEIASKSESRAIVAGAVEKLADRLIMAHAKDRSADGKPVAAAKGVIDFQHFVERLRSIGFAGPLIAHGLSSSEAPEVFRFLRGLVERAAA
jgi:sugar phosphate isomerase/epimerase